MKNASISDPNGRIHSLDGLRAFSIGLVLLGHLAGTVGSPQFLAGVHSLGNYGVRFFFVISGFLITWLLLGELDRTGTVNLKKFFTNRVLRIFPAFYAYVGIGAVLGYYGLVELLPGDLLHAATYTMNYHDERAWHLNHTWSLAVEEQFYLIWPFVFLMLGRKYAPALLLSLVLVVPCIRAVMWFGYDMSPTAMMRQFQAVADSLAVGCLMAFLLRSGRLPVLRRPLLRFAAWVLAAVLLAGSAGAYLIAPAFFYVFGQSLANIGAAVVVYLCIGRKDGVLYRLLNNRAAVFVGTLSYSLYLWQEPFLNSTAAAFPQSYPYNLLFTVAAALTSYFLIEKPFLTLKNRGLGRWKPGGAVGSVGPRTVSQAASVCFVLAGGTVLAAGDLQSLVAPRSIQISAQEVYPALNAQSVLTVAGVNEGDAVATVVVRVDDKPSPSYWNRVNIERQVLQGEFELEIPLGGLRTHTGRAVRPREVLDITVFPGSPSAPISLERAVVVNPDFLPAGTLGWDFGPEHAAVFPGFQKVDPTGVGVSGKKLTGLQRPAGDALIADGIRGLERFEAAVPNGRWRVTLWTEDPGAWQSLPYWTHRQIAVNGKAISRTSRSAQEWFGNVYTAGARAEAVLDGTLWDLTAGRRGGLVTGEVVVEDGRFVLELNGDLAAARYVAGLLLEPADQHGAMDVVQEYRKRVFDRTWRLSAPAPAQDGAAVAAFSGNDPSVSERVEGVRWLLAKDDSRSRDIWLSAPPEDQRVELLFQPGPGWPDSLSVELRAGIWGFSRADPGGTVVLARAERLAEVADGVRLTAGWRRRLNIRAVTGPETAAGTYSGNLLVKHRTGETAVSVTLSVLDLVLPPADRSIGVYLEEAPHLSWFADFSDRRVEAVNCDLARLRRFGLTAIAPPFSLPTGGFAEQHIDMARRVRDAGFHAPTVSYAGYKWAARKQGAQTAVMAAAAVARHSAASGLGPVYWSIADEPGNSPGGYEGLRETVALFRSVAPMAGLVGHLNNKHDRRVLNLFDIVLVNPGFGVDRHTVEDIRNRGVTPWFYNMNNPRAAAGFYLWRAGADGYLQWHARMPTADPFDPTDGREDDFQFLYPSLNPCDASDIHEDLIALSDGISDLRWLLWLEHRALRDPAAKRLVAELRSDVPDTWRNAVDLDDRRLDLFRERIIDRAAASLRPGPLQNAASD